MPETIERLCEYKNIVAIKEASTLARVQELIKRVGDKINVLTGEDGIAAECVLQGAKGVISVTANIAPAQVHDMVAAALKGDRETAMRINDELADLHKCLFLESNPIPAKWAATQMNLAQSGIRLPLVPFSKTHQPALLDAMKKAGVL